MDNTSENWYKVGERAYLLSTGEKVFRNGDSMIMAGNTWDTDWDNLRAYQDEQRKKGETITLRGTDAEDWCLMDDTNGFYFRVEGIWPEIYVEDGYNGPVIGKFTNFRWRPGHGPKGGKHGSN